MNENYANLEKLFRDEESVQKLLNGNVEDILKENGIKLTVSETALLKDKIEMYRKMEKLSDDEELINRVLTDDIEETRKNLAEIGIILNGDELSISYKEELSDEDLENVSGGYRIKCTHCDKEWSCSRLGVTAKYLFHRHNGRSYLIFTNMHWIDIGKTFGIG